MIRAGAVTWFSLCALGSTPAVLGAQTFEGTITMRINAPGRGATAQGQATMPQQMEYQVRGGKVRVNLGGGMAGGMAMLAVPQEQKIYMLMVAQQSYMEMPMVPPSAAASAAAAAADEVKVTRTGRKEVVAGFTCEHVLLTPAKGEGTDMCLTTALGRYMDPMQGMRRGPAPAWQKQIADGFPLKVSLPDGSVAMEVTKVEKKRLANELFSVPANFTKIASPSGRPPG
jgi:Domain of unknown function (DUF4412)